MKDSLDNEELISDMGDITSEDEHNDGEESFSEGPQIGSYQLGRTLGCGEMGKVKLARNIVTGEKYAVKIIRKEGFQIEELRVRIKREIAIMKILDHPNILAIHDVFESGLYLILVLEYAEGGELFDVLCEKGYFEPEEALDIFQQLVDALEHIQLKRICHRDIKPENILLMTTGQIKLADFGFADVQKPDELLHDACGSPHYAAPELVSRDSFDGLKADIWSLGVVLYALLTGGLPFDNDNLQEMLRDIRDGIFYIPENLPEGCRDLLNCILQPNPEKRFSLQEIKKHYWYRSQERPQNNIIYRTRHHANSVRCPILSAVKGILELGWTDEAEVVRKLGEEAHSIEKEYYFLLLEYSDVRARFRNKLPVVCKDMSRNNRSQRLKWNEQLLNGTRIECIPDEGTT